MNKGDVYRYHANTEPDCGLHEYNGCIATIYYVIGDSIIATLDDIEGPMRVYKDELFDLNDPEGFSQS